MKLLELFHPERLCVPLLAQDKDGVIRELIASFPVSEVIKQKLRAWVWARERHHSTGIGGGIAVPHARGDIGRPLLCALGVSREGIDYQALDGKAVHLIVLIAVRKEDIQPHIEALARISRHLRHPELCEALRRASDAAAVLELLRAEESRDQDDERGSPL